MKTTDMEQIVPEDSTEKQTEEGSIAEVEQKEPDTIETEPKEEISVDDDPYLLREATYIQTDIKWKNKQRTLILSSRGISHRHRHLMEDLKRIMPHHKAEPKIDKKLPKSEIVEIAVERSCNNIMYFDSRKNGRFLYLWMVRAPVGPSFKFQIRNIHTSNEVNMAGNYLLYSRPILSFDQPFDDSEQPQLRLFKEMIIQMWGTPRNHPKCKPFFDHVLSFTWLNGNIWVRHYQVHPLTDEDHGSHNRIAMTEIGPRFAMTPIRAFGGLFGGPSLYLNGSYLTPTQISSRAKREIRLQAVSKMQVKLRREEHFHEHYVPEADDSIRNLIGSALERKREREMSALVAGNKKIKS